MAKDRLYRPEYLQELVADANSSVQLKKSVKEILLQPFHLRDIAGAVAEILDSSLLRYDRALDALLLGYRNPKCLGDKALCHLESSQVSVKIQADFYIFQPRIGNTYNAMVHKLGVAHVGCLLYNHFNISLPIPPEKLGLLKTLTLQTEVTFKLEELDLTGDLPFFRGQLVSINSKPVEQSSKSVKTKMPKVSQNTSKLSTKPKEDVDITKKEKKDNHSKLSLNQVQISESEVQSEKDAQLAKADKKKLRLSLKQIKGGEDRKKKSNEDDGKKGSNEDDGKKESSDDINSCDVITPYQKPGESRRLNLNKSEESDHLYEKFKPLLKSLRESPLKQMSSGDESLPESYCDIFKDFMYSPAKISKASQNSQSDKGSSGVSRTLKKANPQKSITGLSLQEKVTAIETQAKSPGGKNSGSQASNSFLNVPRADDSSTEDNGKASHDKKSSSEDSEDDSESSLKRNSFPVATSTQKSPPKKNSRPTPDVPVKLEVLSSEESDHELVKILTCSGISLGNDGKRSPVKPLLPKSTNSTSSNNNSDSDDERTSAKKSIGSPLLESIPRLGGTAKPVEWSISDEFPTDSGPGNPHQQHSDESSSDSESASKAPSTRSENTHSKKIALANDSSSSADNSDYEEKRSRAVKEARSRSNSDVDAVAFRSPQLVSTKSPTVKTTVALPPKNPFLNQTYLDGSLHSRSPLACSTPTGGNPKSCPQNLLIQNLKSFSSRTLMKDDPEKTDEREKKNESTATEKKVSEKSQDSKLKEQVKHADFGYEEIKVKPKNKNKKKKKSKLSRKTPEGESSFSLEERCRLLLEKFCPEETEGTDTYTKTTKRKLKKNTKEAATVKTAFSNIEKARREPAKHKKEKKMKTEKKIRKDSNREVKGAENRDLVKNPMISIETAKFDDIVGQKGANPDRKTKKRKLSESEDIQGKDNTKVQSDEIGKHPKKRKLFSLTDVGSFSPVNISSNAEKLSLPSRVLEPMKLGDKKTKETFVNPDTRAETSLVSETDTKKKRKSILFGSVEPLVSESVTQPESNKEESKPCGSAEDNSLIGALISDVKTALSDEGAYKKRKKKKSKVETVEQGKSSGDVIPPLFGILKEEDRKTSTVKEGRKSDEDPTSSVSKSKKKDIQAPVDSRSSSKTPSESGLDSKKKLERKKKSRSIDSEPVLEPSSSLQVDSNVPLKKRKTSELTNALKVSGKEEKKKKKEEEVKDTGDERGCNYNLDFDFSDIMRKIMEKRKKDFAEMSNDAGKPEKKRKESKKKARGETVIAKEEHSDHKHNESIKKKNKEVN